MIALDRFWPKTVGAIRSITIELVAAIFVSGFLTSLLIALRVRAACTRLTAGELWPIILSVSAVPTMLVGLIVPFRTMGSLEQTIRAHQELACLAWIDGLTGLLNRPGFDAVAAEAFMAARRLAQPISALACDIDAFRRLNDKYGHEAGDLALRNLAQMLEEAIGRRCAILGRQDGDEFAILLPGIDLREAVMIAECLHEICEARALVQQDPAQKFTISVGVATEASGASELGGLLRRADAALHQAKRAGGNQVAPGPTMFVRRQSMPKIEQSPIRSTKLKSATSIQQP
jgi:diguanylate cyclase (GGDEF)-like protein